MRLSHASLVKAGIKDGQDLENVAPYVNYALFETSLKTTYGEHLERLREMRKKYIQMVLWDLRVDGNSKCVI